MIDSQALTSLVEMERISSAGTGRTAGSRRSSSAPTSTSASTSTNGRSYARSIKACRELPIASSFYSFQHYAGLSDFFNDGPGLDGGAGASASVGAEPDPAAPPPATFHTYTSDGVLHRRDVRTWKELQSALYTPHDRKNSASPPHDSTSAAVTGTLVFLRGWQPRDWLIAVGDRYRVDHEFWRRHLDFPSAGAGASGNGEVFSDSALPSSSAQMLQLRAPTLGNKQEARPGGRGSGHNKSRHEMLAALRDGAEASMRQHTRQYAEVLARRRAPPRHGESIVRGFALHDLDLFSIEQDISMWAGWDAGGSRHAPTTSWIAIIWLDYGRNLSRFGPAPWQSGPRDVRQKGGYSETSTAVEPVQCRPTIQYRPGIVLDRKLSAAVIPSLSSPDHGTNPSASSAQLRKGSATTTIKATISHEDSGDNGNPQTACLLADESGKLLDNHTAARDALYACSDVLRFAAAAEAQFFDMARAVLTREMAAAAPSPASSEAVREGEAHKPLVMWSLQYNRQALVRHAENLRAIVQFLEAQSEEDGGSGGGGYWPRHPEAWDNGGLQQHQVRAWGKTADDMAKLLRRDYGFLLRRAETLAGEYGAAMSMLMNAAAIDESQRAIAQAEGVAKLTALAFVFVPLSFTTSLFGMNFTELADGNRLSVWVWAVTAFASLFFSIVCLKWFAWTQSGHRFNFADFLGTMRQRRERQRPPEAKEFP